MRLRSYGPKLLCAFLLLLLTSSLSFGQTFTDVFVDCTGAMPGAFTSLNQAIANSPDNSDFQVIGTCTESVGVTIQNRRNLVIVADPVATIQTTAPGGELILINHSQNIEIDNLTLNGGAGVDILDSSSISLIGNTIENSSFFGINSNNSDVLVVDGSVTGSTRSGVVTSGGTMQINGVNISNNGRIGISSATTHLIISDGNSPTIVNNNGVAGVQIFNSSQGDFTDLQITNSAGNNFGLEVSTNSAVVMQGGSISGNTGIGVNCVSTTHCEFLQTQINGNFGNGVQATIHSELNLDGGVQISGNQGVGVLVDQHSAFASNGGNTISGNTGDGLIVNALSTLDFLAADTITATANNLALNCNNGSLVTGDISTYKPKKCGVAFQAVPIH
ncbi:MAG TPA: right-handed parallel beta-helix repeat-containing protein [Candidatus Angelobacter sp.]|nr:right-handed parallel beta-helix repeat-containing protein [Candidatus Angelobacter sp.]